MRLKHRYYVVCDGEFWCPAYKTGYSSVTKALEAISSITDDPRKRIPYVKMKFGVYETKSTAGYFQIVRSIVIEADNDFTELFNEIKMHEPLVILDREGIT